MKESPYDCFSVKNVLNNKRNFNSVLLFLLIHCSGSGYYMYIEASNTFQVGHTSLLQYSMPNSITGNNVCVQFWYHMYSSSPNTMGSLNVRFVLASSIFPITIANINGNQGNLWKRFQFRTQIPNGSQPVKVSFRIIGFYA